MNRRIFIGIDPGSNGACAVLAVADVQDADDVHGDGHGRVLAAEVFDLPVVVRDSGGHDLDVMTFKVALRTAIVNVAGQSVWPPPDCDGLVEYPILNAGFGGGVRQKVQQGVNAGAVWAALKATGLVQVAWVDSDKWRAELGDSCPKGQEFEAALSVVDGVELRDDEEGKLGTTDRCVAVLLAEVARRRWLGTAVVPKKMGTTRATKARKADRRKEAIARAVAPLPVAKARVLAVRENICLRCCVEEKGKPCAPRRKCCDSRLLGWAWQAALDLPEAPTVTDPMRGLRTPYCAVLGMTSGVPGSAAIVAREDWTMTLRTARSKDWTTATAGAVWTIPREVGDLLIDHGLVQMDPGEKGIVYRPTKRGLMWSTRLRGEVTT